MNIINYIRDAVGYKQVEQTPATQSVQSQRYTIPYKDFKDLNSLFEAMVSSNLNEKIIFTEQEQRALSNARRSAVSTRDLNAFKRAQRKQEIQRSQIEKLNSIRSKINSILNNLESIKYPDLVNLKINVNKLLENQLFSELKAIFNQALHKIALGEAQSLSKLRGEKGIYNNEELFNNLPFEAQFETLKTLIKNAFLKKRPNKLIELFEKLNAVVNNHPYDEKIHAELLQLLHSVNHLNTALNNDIQQFIKKVRPQSYNWNEQGILEKKIRQFLKEAGKGGEIQVIQCIKNLDIERQQQVLRFVIPDQRYDLYYSWEMHQGIAMAIDNGISIDALPKDYLHTPINIFYLTFKAPHNIEKIRLMLQRQKCDIETITCFVDIPEHFAFNCIKYYNEMITEKFIEDQLMFFALITQWLITRIYPELARDMQKKVLKEISPSYHVNQSRRMHELALKRVDASLADSRKESILAIGATRCLDWNDKCFDPKEAKLIIDEMKEGPFKQALLARYNMHKKQ